MPPPTPHNVHNTLTLLSLSAIDLVRLRCHIRSICASLYINFSDPQCLATLDARLLQDLWQGIIETPILADDIREILRWKGPADGDVEKVRGAMVEVLQGVVESERCRGMGGENATQAITQVESAERMVHMHMERQQQHMVKESRSQRDWATVVGIKPDRFSTCAGIDENTVTERTEPPSAKRPLDVVDANAAMKTIVATVVKTTRALPNTPIAPQTKLQVKKLRSTRSSRRSSKRPRVSSVRKESNSRASCSPGAAPAETASAQAAPQPQEQNPDSFDASAPATLQGRFHSGGRDDAETRYLPFLSAALRDRVPTEKSFEVGLRYGGVIRELRGLGIPEQMMEEVLRIGMKFVCGAADL